LENVRKFQEQVVDVQTTNAQLERANQKMQEQVMYMQGDWKREQDLCK